MRNTIQKIIGGENLSEQEMMSSLREIMDGAWSESEIEIFLRTLAQRGETVDEICGAARVLREKAVTIKAPEGSVDCCGTGGDHAGTYNISTAVALVAAACGVPVAKHGNRASSSKTGAADVLEALGVNLDVPVKQLEDSLRHLNFAFLMAPKHHSAMKHVAAVRRKIGTRTIFNLLGPLANPAQTKFQLVGVYDRTRIMAIAEVLRRLSTECAWVVHGKDGLDEITVTDETIIAVLENGTIREQTFSPADFGLPISNLESLKGGDAKENAQALLNLLKGKKTAYRDIVLANTSAVLNIRGVCKDLRQGASMAAEALDSGKALETLNAYITFTNETGASA